MAYAYASLGLACVFLALLFALHVLKPETDPSWRWISEYEIGRFGWMMRLAFLCWGGSVFALALALWPSLQPVAGTLGRWWLIVIAVALCGAGLFKTDPITDRTSSMENRLHAIFGAVVILTFPIAATLVTVGLSRGAAWPASLGLLIPATTLTWLGLVVFLGSNIRAGGQSRSGERIGASDIRVGWQNRFMVVTYALWIVALSIVSLHV